ncbi:hypothetical protein CJ483_13330 [Bacillus sp. PK3_68]|nr:hypothetical protein CJ483_13330 [Bacillus sp. PK3_68]
MSSAHVGSINAYIVSSSEIMKTAVLSSAASIICAIKRTYSRPEDIQVTERLV